MIVGRWGQPATLAEVHTLRLDGRVGGSGDADVVRGV